MTGCDATGGETRPNAANRTAPNDPFAALDATAQAELVRSGEAQAIELIDAAIARVEALDRPLNAMTCRLFERARDQARALTSAAAQSQPFAGVPFLVKDLSALEDAPLTFGSRFFARNIAKESEESVLAALSAGLIPIGKTNTPEFGLLCSTEPLLFGSTRNPWALERSAGGSSGGAAAAVAAGLTPVAGAGDGGGSIRIPASCCGLFGLKPSRDRVIPPRRSPPGDLSVQLGVSRSVRDTARLLEISERRGEAAKLPPIGFVSGSSERRLRIAVGFRTVTGTRPDPEVAAALKDVATLCADLGHHVEEAEPKIDEAQSVERFLALWSATPTLLMRLLPILRMRMWKWGPVDEFFEPWTLGLADWSRKKRGRNRRLVRDSLAFFATVERDYAAFFERYDVTLTPVLRTPPAMIGEHAPDLPFETLLERAIDYVGYTPVYNAIGAPAMSVPLSWSAESLPIGAHFGAKPGDDETLLALAYELEAVRPWAHRWPPYSVSARNLNLA